MSNESKWLTAIGGIVAALVPLLIAYGVFTQEVGDMWQAFILAIAAAVVPLVVTSLVKNYNNNAVTLTTARLQAGVRE